MQNLEIVSEQSKGAAAKASFSFFHMKKIVVFVVLLIAFILSEYFFLTELFSGRRTSYLLGSAIFILICVFAFIRYFKKSVLPHDKLINQ